MTTATHNSPAQRHAARILAAKAAAASRHGQPIQGSAYDLMLAKLINDKQRLKAIKSIQRKIELKREILPDYDDWINAALQHGNGAQDLVLTTALVWHIDAGNYARALDIAQYCLVHNLNLPDQYARDVPTMLLDEIPGAYLEGRFETATAAVETLRAVQLLTVNADVPDQASAKLYKALGYAQIGKMGNGDIDFDQLTEEQASKALDNLRRALDLFQNIGVKKDIERLERRLKKTADDETATSPPPSA
ncbi:phage terminase small subunit [Undibacterium umbellatum]|uniref:Integrase n=1 Tax=Undibacterium umbellatum TaxID=2762300 RepID=A0ABR6ZIT5_9BURK|nr:phage terminase small subunit [Undibacterium umbellatum]MBC3911594.1 integrase [Undibacterium umbellatum]